VAQLRRESVSEALARRDALWEDFEHQIVAPAPRRAGGTARKLSKK